MCAKGGAALGMGAPGPLVALLRILEPPQQLSQPEPFPGQHLSHHPVHLRPRYPVVGQGKCPGKCSAKMSLRYAAMVSDVDGLGTIRCFHPGGPPASR